MKLNHADELILQGREARSKGNLTLAAEIYERAAAKLEGMGNVHRSLHCLQHASELRLKAGVVPLAQTGMERVLATYQDHQANGHQVANAVRTAALVEEAAGSVTSARRRWHEARDLYARLGMAFGVSEAEQRLMGLSIA